MSLRFAAPFTAHAVLQQGKPLPVWGWAAPGAAVTVRFAGQSATGTADAAGKWTATLPALAASAEPRELTATAGGETVTAADVLVGEVWICSGQSNMQWTVSNSNDSEAEIAAGTHPTIRLLTCPRIAEIKPVPEIKASWERCTPETVASFSAVGYFYGRALQAATKYPIGLVNTNWGGTYAETWTSREGLLSDPYYKGVVEKYEESLLDYDTKHAAFVEKMKQGEDAYYPKDPGNEGLGKGFADPATDTSAWPTISLPANWQSIGMNFSGVVWFRRELELPASWAGRDLTLRIGSVDKIDVTYFNNVEVGNTPISPESWCTPRQYTVPGKLVQAGANTIAVRACSHVYQGGMMGPASVMRVEPVDATAADTAISLTGKWRLQVEHNYGLIQPFPGGPMPQGPGNANSPYILHHSMIEPLLPLAVRGAIWYQGESNAGNAWRYRTLFSLMIRDWRRVFGQGDIPFYFVQLANWRAIKDEPAPSDWAELREAQNLALQLPNTGVAVTIDIGEANDIHPRNKQDVGLRLAQWALHGTYEQRDVVPSGPLYAGLEAAPAGSMRVRFEYAAGLRTATPGEAVQGFAVAGEDQVFHWADATIDGETVLVSSSAVATPVAVRYGWADNPIVNLYNAADLPASPFRSDDWPGITVPK